MAYRKTICAVLAGALGLMPLAGCENIPASKGTQGAVIGGLGGAIAGAAIGGRHNQVLGALIGGALGAGGGYLIGANMDKTDRRNREEAIQASRRAEAYPARPGDVSRSTTADINGDGYVTMDEVVAMRQAGLSDDEMIGRLQATGHLFELTAQQELYLRDRGVSDRVINAMVNMRPAPYGRDRISQPPTP